MNYTVDKSSGLLKLHPNDQPIQCGFEIGNWVSYLSAGRDKERATHSIVDSQGSAGKVVMSHRVGLGDHNFCIEQEEKIVGSILHRQFTVTPVTPSPLGDFVGRFSFSDCGDAVVSIDGETIKHKNSNRYHQYHTNKVSLTGGFGRFVVETTKSELPDGMEYVMYARDEPPDTWIIHARALARDTGFGVMRLYQGPFTHSEVLDRIVSRFSPLAGRLRRLRERTRISSRYIPIQYGDLYCLENNKIKIDIKCRYYDEQ